MASRSFHRGAFYQDDWADIAYVKPTGLLTNMEAIISNPKFYMGWPVFNANGSYAGPLPPRTSFGVGLIGKSASGEFLVRKPSVTAMPAGIPESGVALNQPVGQSPPVAASPPSASAASGSAVQASGGAAAAPTDSGAGVASWLDASPVLFDAVPGVPSAPAHPSAFIPPTCKAAAKCLSSGVGSRGLSTRPPPYDDIEDAKQLDILVRSLETKTSLWCSWEGASVEPLVLGLHVKADGAAKAVDVEVDGRPLLPLANTVLAGLLKVHRLQLNWSTIVVHFSSWAAPAGARGWVGSAAAWMASSGPQVDFI